MPPFRLHSKYNPHKEAEQFVNTIGGSPSIIVITEPGESYLAAALRSSFPHARLMAIRYTDDLFSDSDTFWDVVWRPLQGNLPFFLLSYIPDELLGATRFLSWKASDKAFPDQAEAVWKSIRYAIDLLTSVMHTRSFFGRIWFKNMIDNAVRLVHPAKIHFGTQDFILAAAGPSLQHMTAAQTTPYTLVAVTSAYSALTARSILPQLCISTDAGYWARRLFDGIPHTVPLAFPLEAAVPAAMLQHNPCGLLSYGSPLENMLCTALGLSPLAARENGTVTGTACDLLLRHTQQNIILTGVDLAATQGLTHAQPHQSTVRLLCSANRLQPFAASLAMQQFQTQALETYRQWFLQLPPERTKRLFRVQAEGAAIPNITTLDSIPLPLHEIPNATSAFSAARPFLESCYRGKSQKRDALSIESYTMAPFHERMQAVHSLLSALHTSISAMITEKPQLLAAQTQTTEKQVCALCGYTAYCNVVKATTDREAQQKLAQQVDGVFAALLKRTAV